LDREQIELFQTLGADIVSAVAAPFVADGTTEKSAPGGKTSQ
jgi:hypothetical protein